MKAIREKINQERIKSVNLKDIAIEEALTYDKRVKIREEQQKVYDKLMFFKKLNEAVNKQNKEEI
jgi:hypothetical protein